MLPNGKVRVAAIYGAGAAIGFSPQQVDCMSIWQLNAAITGYNRAHAPGDNKLSEAEKADIFAWVDGPAAAGSLLSTMTYSWDGVRLIPEQRISFRA